MAATIMTRNKILLYNGVIGGIDWIGDTLKVIPLQASYVPDKGHQFASDCNAHEITNIPGYVGGFGGAGRLALANKNITIDTVNHRVIFDADDLQWLALGPGSEQLAQLGIVKEVTDDNDSLLICVLDTATPLYPNGSDMDWSFHGNGVFRDSL